MRKKIFVIAVLVITAVCLLSCKKKEYTPSAIDEIVEEEEIVTEDEIPAKPVLSIEIELPSQLKDQVEVIYVGKSVDDINYPKVNISFKLLKTVDTKTLCNRDGKFWVIGMAQDENGVDVEELISGWRGWQATNDPTGDKFKEFLEKEPGETYSLTFVGEESSDTQKDLNRVKKFKLKLGKTSYESF